MRAKSKYLVILFFIAIIYGCGKDALSPMEFCAWVNSDESGLKKEKEMNDVIYSAQFRPAEYLTIQNLSRDKEAINNENFNLRMKEADKSLCFVFEVKNASNTGDVLATGVNSNDDYYSRVVYLSYDAVNNFCLVTGGDTLKCRLAQFEQMFKAAPYIRFSLVFDNNQKNEMKNTEGDHSGNTDMTLVFDDTLWGNGLINLKFSSKEINSIPQVRI
jgi:hypothetical protein